jgi:hypothetical protein
VGHGLDLPNDKLTRASTLYTQGVTSGGTFMLAEETRPAYLRVMSTARILIKQGEIVYRFMRFETSSDGSLIILLDRDAKSKRGAMSGNFDPLSNKWAAFTHNEDIGDHPLPSFRFTVHTTGVIHRYADGARKGTIQIEPLYALTKLTGIGIVSIPRPSRLDLFSGTKHRHDTEAVLSIPENISERITFIIELGPKPQEPQSFGVGLNYELYSVVIRVIPNLDFPLEVSEHFVAVMRDTGLQSQIDKAAAEIKFYQHTHGYGAFIFREDKGGAYLAMAAVPMAKPPKLTISFKRPDLQIEIIPFDEGKQPRHKVRFWICDKRGRNKTEDLRQYITSIELDANL